MRPDVVLASACGYEDDGGLVRVYVDGPDPTPFAHRGRGIRTPLFRLFGGEDAALLRGWLDRHKAWQGLRVPVYNRERGVRAVLLAGDWNSGDGSALFALARDRVIRDEAHRRRLRREVGPLVEAVLENPVRADDLSRLQVLEDVVEVGPAGVELATTAEVVAAFFGGD